jgi:hypothetical protein
MSENAASDCDPPGMFCSPIVMRQPVKERIGKLREEIVQIREANRLYLQGGKKCPVRRISNVGSRDCRKS